jgi:hypothetical protein
MKQLIKDVLEDIAESQPNLYSESARENIATVIISAIRASDKGWYLDLDHSEEREKKDKKILESHMIGEQKARESWVCEICGKSTYEVEYDYIGTGTNHLGCELEDEKRKGDRREKNWSQEKHEEKVFNQAAFGDSKDLTEAKIDNRSDNHREYPYNSFVRNKEDLQKQLYVEMTTDGLPEGGDSQAVRDSKTWVDKLAEEIVSDNDTGYIYESPDGGKTVYKRKEGSDKRELVKDWKKINVRT